MLGLAEVCEITRFTFNFIHSFFFLPDVRVVFRFLKNIFVIGLNAIVITLSRLNKSASNVMTLCNLLLANRSTLFRYYYSIIIITVIPFIYRYS